MDIEVTPNPDGNIGTLRIKTSKISIDWNVTRIHPGDYGSHVPQTLGYKLEEPDGIFSGGIHLASMAILAVEGSFISAGYPMSTLRVLQICEMLTADHEKIRCAAKEVMDSVDKSICNP